MPLLTPEMKKALRRVQADKFLTKKQLAEYIGVSESTAIYLTKDNEPQNVKNKVFNAVVSAIAENCQTMNKLDTAITNSKQSKPYYHKIILDLLVQLTTSGKHRSLRAFKQSGDKLTAEQKETLRRYTDSIILLLEIGMAFHEIKQFLVN